jgi:hypothetical protein
LLQKLIDALFKSPSITIPSAARLLNVTHTAAAYNIRKLQKAGIVAEVTGRSRDQVFLAREILGIVAEAQAPQGPPAPTYHTVSAP